LRNALVQSSLQEIQEALWRQVEELLSKGNRALSLAEIEGTFKFPLDGFQRDAVVEFLKGNSVVVCAPTGAGKTAIAEAATIAVLARFVLSRNPSLFPSHQWARIC